ncbi:MAG TPA: ATP-binding protein, partial [Isosphaeraceae bacterium]
NPARPDGVWLSINARPLRDDGGALWGGVIVLSDITGRKRGEEALRAIDERLNLALRSSGVGTWSWLVPEDRLVWDNYVYPLFGLEPGARSQRLEDALDRLHPEDRERVRHEVAHALAVDAAYDAEYRVIWPDGTVRWLTSRGKVDRDAEGRAVRMAGACWDITARKRVESELARKAEELARSNAELEQFAYVASHDLQEPLRMVTSYVQLLARRYRGRLDADADDFIDFAVDGATRMQALINDLLAYSRVGSRGGPVAPTDSRAALENALANLTIAISEGEAVVRVGELPVVRADATQLTQLFQNLISNAIKFRGPDPPRIAVEARRRGPAWVFSVCDNGIGIDPRHVERIFLIFQRLHSRAEYPGTGIGLALCKRIVERHGGRIWVDSRPGRGSSFVFTLPAEEGSPHE